MPLIPNPDGTATATATVTLTLTKSQWADFIRRTERHFNCVLAIQIDLPQLEDFLHLQILASLLPPGHRLALEIKNLLTP